MSPLLTVLLLACTVLVLAVGALVAALVSGRRRAAREQQAQQADLDALREQLGALTARQAQLEVSSSSDLADFVITTEQPERLPVSTSRVVSTTLGEPLIKIVAFGHGVRRALRDDKRAYLIHQVRREYRRRRKATRAAARRSTRRAA